MSWCPHTNVQARNACQRSQCPRKQWDVSIWKYIIEAFKVIVDPSCGRGPRIPCEVQRRKLPKRMESGGHDFVF